MKYYRIIYWNNQDKKWEAWTSPDGINAIHSLVDYYKKTYSSYHFRVVEDDADWNIIPPPI